MYASLALAVALWPAKVIQHCPPLVDSIVIGVAFDARDQFLYCEYFSQIDEYQIAVNYLRNGENFASKTLDYSSNSFIPEVKQKDLRSGEYREASIDQHKVRLSYQMGSDKKTAVAELPIKHVDIVDAGFDNFVKAHWDRLIAGESLSINFGSIAHLKSLPLRIKSLPANKCSQQKNTQPAQHCFSVDIDNSLLRLLLSNIKISYDNNKRLVQFSGVVNLQDDLQKSQTATINYFYKQDYLHDKIEDEKKPQ